MHGRLGKLRRILAREGVRGVFGRVRHTPLSGWRQKPGPAVPWLGNSVQIVDHGNPDLTARVRAFLTQWGIADAPALDSDAATDVIKRWHIGAPVRARAGDLIMLLDGVDVQCRAQASLVLDHNVARLTALSRTRAHYLAVPAPDAPDAEWDLALRRVLIFLGWVAAADAMDFRTAIQAKPQGIPELCLGLPEFPERLEAFCASPLSLRIRMIHGIRRIPGWIGAAETYCQIARAALDHGSTQVLVCQDDAAPGTDYVRRMPLALDYWRESGADLFSGLITDVDESFRVLRVVQRDGIRFVHLNRSVGLVFNIYGPRALQRLAAWTRPTDGSRLTIDRHLAAAEDLDVVICLPYLVRHRPGLQSSIWNFRNDRYDTLIEYSEARLTSMAEAWEVAQGL